VDSGTCADLTITLYIYVRSDGAVRSDDSVALDQQWWYQARIFPHGFGLQFGILVS